jgi:exosortase
VPALGALLLVCYWPAIRRTAGLLVFSDDMAHGFFAPIVAAYLAWVKRREIFPSDARPSAGGLVLLAFGATLGVAASIGGSTTLARFGFMLSLAGSILALGGAPSLRALAFPWFLLFYTFPIPTVLYAEITLPLQLLASRLAEFTLETLGYSVLREGNVLHLSFRTLSVEEACSGIRSLVSLSFFCLVYAYLMERRRALQVFIVLASIPAAILLNSWRVTLTGILAEKHPDWTYGAPHEMLGWAIFCAGFGLVFLAHRLVRAWMR